MGGKTVIEPVEGIARIAGKEFAFPVDHGYGLVLLDGLWTLVEFSCPMESLPPRGTGHIVGQSFPLEVVDGRFRFGDGPVHIGKERIP